MNGIGKTSFLENSVDIQKLIKTLEIWGLDKMGNIARQDYERNNGILSLVEEERSIVKVFIQMTMKINRACLLRQN